MKTTLKNGISALTCMCFLLQVVYLIFTSTISTPQATYKYQWNPLQTQYNVPLLITEEAEDEFEIDIKAATFAFQTFLIIAITFTTFLGLSYCFSFYRTSSYKLINLFELRMFRI